MNSVDTALSHSTFWPRPAHDFHLSVLEIPSEQLFPGKPTIIAAGRRLRLLANCLHTMGALGLRDDIVDPLLEQAAEEILAIACGCDDEECEQLRRIADYVRGHFSERELLPACAEYLEQEVFLLFGPLSTWYNKTPERRISFVMGRPDKDLCRFVADVVNEERLVAWLRERCGDPRIQLAEPLPRIRFVDLAFCGGESDMFPKHYAYFLPENAGYPRAARKKTVVFANVQKHKFDTISRRIGRQLVHGFCAEARPDLIRRALSVWMRGHDLGHFVQHPETNWRRISERDYFWSMACQELWADLVGYSYALETATIDAVGLSKQAMTNVLMAEMLRYAAAGPHATPDSMSANWQLAWLSSHGAARVADGVISVEWEGFQDAMKSLLVAAAPACLNSDVEKLHRLTHGLVPPDPMASVVASAGRVEMFQIYSTSL